MLTLYSKPDCTYCTQAKDLLTARKVEHSILMLGTDFTREALLEKFPEAKTFPIALLEDGDTLYGVPDILLYVNSLTGN